MLIVLILICVLIIILGIYIGYSISDFDVGVVIGFLAVGITGFVISAVMICATAYCIVNARTLDDKIAMYSQENINVEVSVNEAVKSYCEHEEKTYTEIKPDSAILFASMYPELNSNTLVQQQIQVYIDNNAKIKELKEEKINVRNSRWWLYFGK